MVRALRTILTDNRWWHLPRYAAGASRGGAFVLILALHFPLQARARLCARGAARRLAGPAASDVPGLPGAGRGQHGHGHEAAGAAGRPARAARRAHQRDLGIPARAADAGGERPARRRQHHRPHNSRVCRPGAAPARGAAAAPHKIPSLALALAHALRAACAWALWPPRAPGCRRPRAAERAARRASMCASWSCSPTPSRPRPLRSAYAA